VHLRREDEARVVAALEGRDGGGRDEEAEAGREREGPGRAVGDLARAADEDGAGLEAADAAERGGVADAAELVADL
jgi:hypothetical protein